MIRIKSVDIRLVQFKSVFQFFNNYPNRGAGRSIGMTAPDCAPLGMTRFTVSVVASATAMATD